LKCLAAFLFILFTSSIAAGCILRNGVMDLKLRNSVPCLIACLNPLVGVAWIVKWWTLAFLNYLLFEKKKLLGVLKKCACDDVKWRSRLLVACFHWPTSCCKQHTEVFLPILQDKREPKIAVVILARFVFGRVHFNNGFAVRLGCNISFMFTSCLQLTTVTICLMQSKLIYKQCVY